MKTARQQKQKKKKEGKKKIIKDKKLPCNMGIRPAVGSGQSAMASMSATMRYIIFWSVMMGVTGGQELPTPRNHDNLNAAEIRFDPRALSWMEFTKPERSSSHALQQVRPCYTCVH